MAAMNSVMNNNPTQQLLHDDESLSVESLLSVKTLSDMSLTNSPTPDCYHQVHEGKLEFSLRRPGTRPKDPDGRLLFEHSSFMLDKDKEPATDYQVQSWYLMNYEGQQGKATPEDFNKAKAFVLTLLKKADVEADIFIKNNFFLKMRAGGLKLEGNTVTKFDDCLDSFRTEPKALTCQLVFNVIYGYTTAATKDDAYVIEVSKFLVKKLNIVVHGMEENPKDNFLYKIAAKTLHRAKDLFSTKANKKTSGIGLNLHKSVDHPLGPSHHPKRYVFQAQNITGWKLLVKIDPYAVEFGKRYTWDYDSDDTSLGLPPTTTSSQSPAETPQDTEATVTTVARAVDALRPVPVPPLLTLATKTARTFCPATSGRKFPVSSAPFSRDRMVHPGKRFSQGPVATSTPESLGQETTSTFTHESCGCNCEARVEVSTFIVSCSLFPCSIVYG